MPGGGAVSGPLGQTVPAFKVLLLLITQECNTIFDSGMTVVEGVCHWTRCVNIKKFGPNLNKGFLVSLNLSEKEYFF